MNKKQVMGLLVMIFFLAVSAYAKQNQETSKLITADDIVAKMEFQLGLTDSQAIEVKPIIVEHLAKEQQLKLEEKKQLSKVLTGQQLFTWDFLQNEPPPKKDKKKHSGL